MDDYTLLRARFLKDLAKFCLQKQILVWGTTNEEWVKRNGQIGAQSWPIEVDIVDMRSILQQFGMPYYLKIDIEGADGLVLEASTGSLEFRRHFFRLNQKRSALRGCSGNSEYSET